LKSERFLIGIEQNKVNWKEPSLDEEYPEIVRSVVDLELSVKPGALRNLIKNYGKLISVDFNWLNSVENTNWRDIKDKEDIKKFWRNDSTINWALSQIEKNIPIPAPVVIGDKHGRKYLVGGNHRLMLTKAYDLPVEVFYAELPDDIWAEIAGNTSQDISEKAEELRTYLVGDLNLNLSQIINKSSYLMFYAFPQGTSKSDLEKGYTSFVIKPEENLDDLKLDIKENLNEMADSNEFYPLRFVFLDEEVKKSNMQEISKLKKLASSLSRSAYYIRYVQTGEPLVVFTDPAITLEIDGKPEKVYIDYEIKLDEKDWEAPYAPDSVRGGWDLSKIELYSIDLAIPEDEKDLRDFTDQISERFAQGDKELLKILNQNAVTWLINKGFSVLPLSEKE